MLEKGKYQVVVTSYYTSTVVVPSVLCAPALDEAHPDGAHSGQLVDRLEALVDGLRQERRELLVVEDLEVASGRNLANLNNNERE